MEPNRHLPLMFAVLDGAGTPEEARELERLLADDPAARAEYEAFSKLFKKLQSIPRIDPPPGLAEAALGRFQPVRPFARGKTMSQNKRALWIGTAIAATTVVIAGLFFVSFPPGRENVSGTVAPAQRYRAEQPKAEDVQLGDQTVPQLMQSDAFQRLINDPQMRAFLADASVQRIAAGQPELLAAFMKSAP